MKKTYIIAGIVVGAFLALSIFAGIKTYQSNKYASAKTELEIKYAILEKEKAASDAELVIKQNDFILLNTKKVELEKQLDQYKADVKKQIDAFKLTIKELTNVPGDTVYQLVFASWPTNDEVLKYRFAEPQIRGMYLNILEKTQFEGLYLKTNKSLVTCTELNIQNNKLIQNLSDQTLELIDQNTMTEDQNVILQNNLKLSDKKLNQTKRNSWIWKAATVVSLTLLVLK
jgi:hypothetical protein